MKRLVAYFFAVLFFWGILPHLTNPARADVAPDSWMYDYPDARIDTAQNGTYSGGPYVGFEQNSAIAHTVELIAGSVEGVTVPTDAYKNYPQYVAQINQGSALNGINNLMLAMVKNQPASFALWADDMASTLGIRPKAYAQGLGFSGLAPLLPLWKAFRNISYLFLAIFIIIVGFMVMFRKKIDPKTVVTVQNALPRIVITLILITFSYAIVGILIDLMYLVILLGISVIYSSGIQGISLGSLQAQYINNGFWTLFHGVFGSFKYFYNMNTGASSVGALVGALIGSHWGTMGAIIGALVLGLGAGAASGSITGTGAGVGAVSLLLALIICLALIFTWVRIFFLLLNAYIQIITSVLIGPFQILTDVLPGVNGFAGWFRNLVYNLAVFPTVIILLVLGFSITNNINTPTFWTAPLLPSGSTQFLRALIGFGIVILIPGIVNGVKEALKIKPTLSLGTGALTEPVTSTWNTAMQGLSQMYYITMLRHEGGSLVSSLFGGKQER